MEVKPQLLGMKNVLIPYVELMVECSNYPIMSCLEKPESLQDGN